MMVPALTDLQKRVLEMLSQGKHIKVMANELNVGISTLKSMLSKLYREIGVTKGNAAAAWYISHRAALESSDSSKPMFYQRAFTSARFDEAIAHWLALPETGRPAAARQTVALMLLLLDRIALAGMEARLLGAHEARLFDVLQKWLDGAPGGADAAERYVKTLEGGELRVGLHALIYGASRTGEERMVTEMLRRLVTNLYAEIDGK